jgi:hypothetical protein
VANFTPILKSSAIPFLGVEGRFEITTFCNHGNIIMLSKKSLKSTPGSKSGANNIIFLFSRLKLHLL